MKRFFLFCLLVLTALYFLTSCENRTDGLLPIDETQDTPPAYVMASIRLQYPSATDMKITVIEPNKLWRVEFAVSGQIFGAFLSENELPAQDSGQLTKKRLWPKSLPITSYNQLKLLLRI